MRDQIAPAAIITAGLLDGGLNGATAVARSDCTARILLREAFMAFCRRHPDLALRLMSEIGTHLRRMAAFVDLVTAAGIQQRLARVLLDLRDEAGSEQFALPCGQAELAARLGTVRELIYRHLKLLEARGVLRFAGKQIVVTDSAALLCAAGVSIVTEHVFEPHAAPPHPACLVLGNPRTS